MLGWHISVFRQAGDSSSPATVDSKEGTRLAVWQADVDGLRWIRDLVESGQAIDLGGNGYPCRYTALAGGVIPQLVGGPPQARTTWLRDPDDVVTSAWAGRTVIERIAINECRPDEWLLIEAWDES